MHLSVANLTERLGVLHSAMDSINEQLVRVEASGTSEGNNGGDGGGAGGFAARGGGHDNLVLEM